MVSRTRPNWSRPLPRPGRSRSTPKSFVVKDATGQALACLYFENELQRQVKGLPRDEAFLIAVKIAKLPRVARQILRDIPGRRIRSPNRSARVPERSGGRRPDRNKTVSATRRPQAGSLVQRGDTLVEHGEVLLPLGKIRRLRNQPRHDGAAGSKGVAGLRRLLSLEIAIAELSIRDR